MEELIGSHLLLFHLSLAFQFTAFTGRSEVLWSLLQLCSSSQMKEQFITDHYINYFSEVPLLFKQQGSELAQLEDTHVLSIIYCKSTFKLCGTSGQQQINQAVWLGGDWNLSASLLPQRTGQSVAGRDESLMVMTHTRAWPRWPLGEHLIKGTLEGKPRPQQGKTKALSTFLCLLQSLQITFPIFSPHPTTSLSCARSGAKITLSSNTSLTTSSWGGTGLQWRLVASNRWK